MITCPQCGGQNLPGMAYCENCGSPLPQAGATSAPAANAYAPSASGDATVSSPGGTVVSAPSAPSAPSAAPPAGLVTTEDPASIALPQPVMPADQPPPGPNINIPSPTGSEANGVVGDASIAAEPLDASANQSQSALGTADLPQLGSLLPPQTQARATSLALTFPSGQTFSMQGDEANVGRADVAQNWRPELDVIPYGGGAPDLGVSRHHARVMRHDNGFAVADVGSTNGTYVNGHAVPYNQPVPLNNGDTLSFGALNTQVAIS